MSIANKEFVLNKLQELTTYAKKNLGQNFLIDDNVSNKIVDALEIEKDDTVIEIGPGLGALTFNLVKYDDAHIVAYDIDEVMVNHLSTYFSYQKNFEVKLEDFLNVDINNINKEKNISFIGNLPYYITTPILERILRSNIKVKNCVFMVQKEVYERLNAKVNSKEYGPLSIMISYVGKLSKVMEVRANCFYPAPHVDSLVFKIAYYNNIDNNINNNDLYKFLNQMFLMRRKTILNNLSTYIKNKELAINILNQCNIDTLRRPESITLDEYLELYKVYKDN